jgi:DNA-directed RNA polymerase specialized sigma24 family protein
MTEAEVSTTLGVSAGSVKSYVHKGLERLRRTLAIDEDLEVQLADGS